MLEEITVIVFRLNLCLNNAKVLLSKFGMESNEKKFQSMKITRNLLKNENPFSRTKQTQIIYFGFYESVLIDFFFSSD